jgi:hypothetical protein
LHGPADRRVEHGRPGWRMVDPRRRKTARRSQSATRQNQFDTSLGDLQPVRPTHDHTEIILPTR